MAINESQYCELVRRLAEQRNVVLDLADIRDSLSNALDALAVDAYHSPEYSLLEMEFTLPLVSGACDLSSRTDLMVACIETVKHPDIDGSGTAAFFSRIPNGTRADLAQLRNTIFPPYVLEKNFLYLSLGQGTWPLPEDVPPDTADLAITSQKIPLITEVPVQLEDRLIEVGLGVAIGMMNGNGKGKA